MTKQKWPLILLVFLLAACRSEDNTPSTPNVTATSVDIAVTEATTIEDTNQPTPTEIAATAVPTTTATPTPPKNVVVCMAAEPESLYLYGDHSATAVAVRHALYESPYTELDFVYQPLALTELPTLENGGAVLENVTVDDGDMVMSADRQVATLGPGIPVINSDGERVVYDGEPIEMVRLSVEYTLNPMVWSDGTPVTAADSVFSFEMATDLSTPAIDRLADLTQSYVAVDDDTVRWTGFAGLCRSGLYDTRVDSIAQAPTGTLFRSRSIDGA
ncbi:MAG: hypothetical protein R3C44_07675 [Chloroflexota bacterium]